MGNDYVNVWFRDLRAYKCLKLLKDYIFHYSLYATSVCLRYQKRRNNWKNLLNGILVYPNRHNKWQNLPNDLLIDIIQRLDLETFFKVSVVCRSWKSTLDTPSLPLKRPCLMLAEETNTNTTRRSIYSLSTKKLYDIDLPEASGREIFSTNKGWLVALGKDLEINLLHPFSRKQIPLPPLLSLPIQFDYEAMPPEKYIDIFVHKVVLSSTVHSLVPPTVMVIYGSSNTLSFTRLGDRAWGNIDVPVGCVDDIVYHKGIFYAIDCHGVIFKCDTDNIIEGCNGRMISRTPIKTRDSAQKYLVESLCGSYLFLLIRFRKGQYYEKRTYPGQPMYYTHKFIVWKLELQYSESSVNPSCTWTKVCDLGDQALFVGRTSSTSVPSSEYIKPNCIYFTDDMTVFFDEEKGGGHDMGIFNLESSTIEPHFTGESLHLTSPSLWLI